MKLSAKCRCGVRILTDLATHYEKGPERVGDISRRQNISVKYLEQLIRPLKRADLIISVRGPKGGHMLAQSPDKVTLGQIVRVLDSQHSFGECFCNEDKCSSPDICKLRQAWLQAHRAFFVHLDRVPISELIGECCA